MRVELRNGPAHGLGEISEHEDVESFCLAPKLAALYFFEEGHCRLDLVVAGWSEGSSEEGEGALSAGLRTNFNKLALLDSRYYR